MYIPLKTHNILDYVVGAALILSPYLFGFSDVFAARNVFLALGFGLVAYSAVTKYYYSLAKWLALGPHMTLDVILGATLIVSPWLFSYNLLITDFQMALHWIFGLGAVLMVSLTKPKTEAEKIRMGEDIRITTSRAA